MSFMDSIKTCFGKYATFSGRASRSEFWWFVLFVIIASAVLGMVDTAIFGPREVLTMTGIDGMGNGMDFGMSWKPQPITGLFMLATLLPGISVMVRRLHDTNRSGWWYWIALLPMIGIIALIVFAVSKGTGGDNDFGPDPLA